MTRRQWLEFGAMGAASLIAYPTVIEPGWLEVTETPIRLPGVTGNKPIRLLHLSDFHASVFVPHEVIDRAITLGLGQRPDFACLTGDFVTSGTDFDVDRYVSSLRRLSERVPTYGIFGNHDRGEWALEHGGLRDHGIAEKILKLSNVRLLHNCAETLTVDGSRLRLAGVGDLWGQEIDGEAALGVLDGDMPVVLMSHNPDSKAALEQHRWDLMLSGHTHGGQVLVPFRGARYAPVQDKSFVAGLKPWRGRQIFVTRGVGNLGGVRFRCRPEVSLLRLA